MKRWLYISLIAVILIAILMASAPLLMSRPENVVDSLPRAGEYPERPISDITEITIHHTAGPDNQSPWDIARFHVEDRGWPGIAYHFLIDPSGKIFQTNQLTAKSWHANSANGYAVGVCLIGNLDLAPMTSAQKKSLKRLIRRLRAQLPNRLDVRGHNAHKATSCPGSTTDISEFQ